MSQATARTRTTAPRRRDAPSRPPRLKDVSRPARRRRVPEVLAVAVLAIALLLIVVGQTVLAQGQLKLGHLNAALTAETSKHGQTVLRVAALETPSRISSEASSLQLVQPKKVLQLPMVSLATPLAPIRIIGSSPQGAVQQSGSDQSQGAAQ